MLNLFVCRCEEDGELALPDYFSDEEIRYERIASNLFGIARHAASASAGRVNPTGSHPRAASISSSASSRSLVSSTTSTVSPLPSRRVDTSWSSGSGTRRAVSLTSGASHNPSPGESAAILREGRGVARKLCRWHWNAPTLSQVCATLCWRKADSNSQSRVASRYRHVMPWIVDRRHYVPSAAAIACPAPPRTALSFAQGLERNLLWKRRSAVTRA
jgi:hypothetical protein